MRTADHWVDESLRVKKANAENPNTTVQNLIETGQHYFDQGNYSEAVVHYSKAIEIDPRSAHAQYQLGESYLKLHDPQRAYQALNQAVELAPDNYRARTDLANLLVTVRNSDGSPNQDSLKEAKTQLDILREKQPNSPETHWACSSYYSAQSNLGAAMREAQQAIAIEPSRSESYLVLAMLQDKAKLSDQAEANYKRAIELDPRAMNAQLLLGYYYLIHNHPAEAEQQFRHAITVDPKDAVLRGALASVLLQQGKKDETEVFLKQTKKDLPDNAATYSLLGDFYVNIGDFDKGLTEYGSLYSDHPTDIHLKKNYIGLLIWKNRLDEAAKLNNEILESRSNDIEGLTYKGEILLGKNDVAGAIEALQAALHNNSGNSVAHYELGMAYARESDKGKAESEWREAVRLQPNLADAQFRLGLLDLGRGETDATLRTAEQIISARPYLANGYILKAEVEIKTRKLSDAQHDTEEAIKRAPHNPTLYIQLASIQLAQMHFPEAENFYQQALDKDPSSYVALNGLMRTYIAQKHRTRPSPQPTLKLPSPPITQISTIC